MTRQATSTKSPKVSKKMQKPLITDVLPLQMLDQISDAFIVYDEHWRYVYVNKEAAKVIGVPAKDLIGKVVWEVFPALKTTTPGKYFLQAAKTRQPLFSQLYFPLRLKWFDVRIYPIKGGIAASFHDVTDVKAAEQQKAQLASIVENSADAIWTLSLDKRIISWNKGAEHLYGYKAKEVLGKPAFFLLPKNYHQQITHNIEQVLLKKTIINYESQRVTKKGDIVDVSASMSPVKDSVGEIVGISFIARDITRQKKVETELKASEERYRTLADKERKALDKIDEILDNLSDSYIELDTEYCYVSVNKKAEETLHKLRKEIIGESMFTLVPDVKKTAAYQAIKDAMEMRVPTHIEAYHPYLNKWFESSYYPSAQGVVAFAKDITQRKKFEVTLKQNEERLRMALEGGHGALWEWNVKTGEVWWSAEMYDLWGVPPTTIMNSRNLFKNINREDKLFMKQIIAEGVNQQTSFKHEFRIEHPLLGQRWMESRGRIIHNQHNQLTKIMGISFDITERKTIEGALRSSEEKFRSTFNQTIMPMSLCDSEGNWIAINNAYPKVFGYSEKELRNMNPRQLIHPADLPKSQTSFSQLVQGKIDQLTQERRYIHKNGTLIDGVLHASVIRDERGKIKYIVTIVEDITMRKQAEAALKDSEEKFRTLIEQSTDVIQLLSKDGKILYTSDSIKRVLGYTPEELMGHGGTPFLHPDDAPRFFTAFARLLEKPGNQVTLEYRLKHKKGAWIWIEATGVNHLATPSVRAIIGNFRDITQRKLLEKQKDEFLGIASHELKTPVTSLKAFNQILQRRAIKAGDDASSELLGKMDSQINKLTSLIQDLLDVSKVESGKLKLHKDQFDFDGLISEVVEELQRTTDNHTLRISGTVKRAVVADRERIGQVLTNFLTNAIKYSPAKTQIIVHSEVKDHTIECSVKDSGMGIPKADLSKVFERFFRVSAKSHETVPGMGLGLNIAAEIIKRHNGTIWAESKEGKGSTFYFTLPINEGSTA